LKLQRQNAPRFGFEWEEGLVFNAPRTVSQRNEKSIQFTTIGSSSHHGRCTIRPAILDQPLCESMALGSDELKIAPHTRQGLAGGSAAEFSRHIIGLLNDKLRVLSADFSAITHWQHCIAHCDFFGLGQGGPMKLLKLSMTDLVIG
jgi:hypothetical protein